MILGAPAQAGAPRDPRKQRIARELLRAGIADDSIRVAYQGVVEFYAAVTRPLRGFGPLLDTAEALRETEEMLMQFVILFPDNHLLRAALRATAYSALRDHKRSRTSNTGDRS